MDAITERTRTSDEAADQLMATALDAHRRGRYDLAELSLRRLIADRPETALFHSYLGCALRCQGKLADAAWSYHRALQIRPDYPAALRYLAGIARQQASEASAVRLAWLDLLSGVRHVPTLIELGGAFEDRGSWDEAEAAYARALHIVPDHPAALVGLSTCLRQTGRTEAEVVALRRAAVADPRRAATFLYLGEACERLERWEESASSFARAGELAPELEERADAGYRTKVNYDRFPTDYAPGSIEVDVARFSKRVLNNLNGVPVRHPGAILQSDRPTILLAAMPKSGSTYLIACLSHLFRFPHVPLSFHFERAEQDLYLPSLLYHSAVGTVSQHHLRATHANTRLINAFSIDVVVLVRNLFDAVVSLRDHVMREGPIFKGCHLDESFLDLEKDRQYDMLVDLAVPWLLHFYVSWDRAVRRRQVRACWLTYEEVTSDPVSAIGRVCGHLDRPSSERDIRAALERSSRQPTRLNVGRSGRGEPELGVERVGRIGRMCSYYPDVDFSRVGVTVG